MQYKSVEASNPLIKRIKKPDRIRVKQVCKQFPGHAPMFSKDFSNPACQFYILALLHCILYPYIV